MRTMNISLPDSLKCFVDGQVSQCGHGNSSEYVRDLMRKDHDRLRLRKLLLKRAGSKAAVPADKSYFDSLREGVRSDRKSGAARV